MSRRRILTSTEELSFNFQYFAIRKLHFLLRAKALVVFPGGFGTMDELFETLNLVQCRRIDPLPVVLVGSEFWQRAVNLEFLGLERSDRCRVFESLLVRGDGRGKSGTASSPGMPRPGFRCCAKHDNRA